MFDVGFWELALISVVALVIIGPERLPGAAHTVGLWVGKGRRMLRDVKADIDRELREQNVADLDALKKDIQSAGDEFKDATEKVSASADVKADVEQAAADLKASFEEASPLGKDELSGADDKISGAQPDPVKKTAGNKTGKKTAAKKTTKKIAKKATAKKAAKKTTGKKTTAKKKTGKKKVGKKKPTRSPTRAAETPGAA